MISRSEYIKIHAWLGRRYGKSKRCENPRCPKLHNTFHWALKKGKEYEYKRQNFKRLCAFCHRKYDSRFNNMGNVETTNRMLSLDKKLVADIRWVALSKDVTPNVLLRRLMDSHHSKAIASLYTS